MLSDITGPDVTVSLLEINREDQIMPFIETEASVRYDIINGKRVPVITPKCEVTLTNTETGQEYMSDAEALADVQNTSTDTKAEHIRRDVNVTVEEIKIGADFNISD